MTSKKLRYHRVGNERSYDEDLQSQNTIASKKSWNHEELDLIVNESDETERIANSDNNYLPANQTEIFKKNTEDRCDVILLRNGEEISAKVLIVGINEIKYEKCDIINGSEYSLLKKDVFMITYSNGSKDVFKENIKKVNAKEPEAKPIIKHSHVGGTMSMILGILSVGIGGFLLWPVTFFGIPAFILGIFGLSETAGHPDEYKSKVPSVLGIIFGLIGMILLVVSLLIFL